MRRGMTLLAALLLAMGMLAGPAMAEGHGGSPFDEPHPHVLLIGADVEVVADPPPGSPPYVVHDYDRCVDLAGGKALRQNNFHHNIHFGRAGQALRGAGHIVVPFFDCATLNALYGK
jgi:hypothetical protein